MNSSAIIYVRKEGVRTLKKKDSKQTKSNFSYLSYESIDGISQKIILSIFQRLYLQDNPMIYDELPL
jgi:hypothetical protein